jgi:Fic family protein
MVMVFIQERTVKGKKYIYLEKSVRIGDKITKVSHYLGRKDGISAEKISRAMKQFVLDVDKKLPSLIARTLAGKYKLTYPLTEEEIEKIEEANLKYHAIKASLHKKDWEDVKKRFVANFVFESNALEGNSLTLKNVSEIVFENRIDKAADLREVHDAKNSYTTFSQLFTVKKEITENFIITIHKKLMENIDDRTGYKRVPNVIIGRDLALTKPKDVEKKMASLIQWYKENETKLYPLELAFRFHHQFEEIHPFADGNGRVGRMLLNYILIRHRYYPIIIRKTHRTTYLRVLEAADHSQYAPLLRFGLTKTKETYRKFFEVYYHHLEVIPTKKAKS